METFRPSSQNKILLEDMTHDYMKSKLTGDPYGIVLEETQNKPGIMIEVRT